MTIQFRDADLQSSNVSLTNAQPGDLVVVRTERSTFGEVGYAAPSSHSGWTIVASQRWDTGNYYFRWFSRTVQAGEDLNYVFSNCDVVQGIAYYDDAGDTPVIVPAASSYYSTWGTVSSTQVTAPSVTMPQPGLILGWFANAGLSLSAPSGMTERNNGVTGSNHRRLFADEAVTAGSTGSRTAVGTDSNRRAAGLFAITPANVAPNAPVLSVPADASTIDRTVSQRFDWDFSDPDAGDTQSAYNFRYRVVGAATWTETGWVSSPSTYRDVAGGTFADGVDYEWQAATKDAQGVEGPFSSSWFFTAENPFLSATLNTVTETSTPQPLARVKRKALGVAVDTTTAQPLARRKVKGLGLVTETNTALSIVTRPRIIVALGVATEAVTALSFTVSQRYPDFFFTPPVGKVRASLATAKPFRFYGVTVSSSVVLRNGHFQEVRSPEADEVDDLVEGVTWFPGGRTHQVDNDTKLLLEADGFTVDSV